MSNAVYIYDTDEETELARALQEVSPPPRNGFPLSVDQLTWPQHARVSAEHFQLSQQIVQREFEHVEETYNGYLAFLKTCGPEDVNPPVSFYLAYLNTDKFNAKLAEINTMKAELDRLFEECIRIYNERIRGLQETLGDRA